MSNKLKSITVKGIFKALALVILVFLFFGYGVGVGVYHWPPYYTLKTIQGAATRQHLDLLQEQDSELNYHLLEMSSLKPLQLPESLSASEFGGWQQMRRQAFIERMLYPYPGLVEFKLKTTFLKDGFRGKTFEVTYERKPLFRYFRLIPNATSKRQSGKFSVILAFMGHGNVQQVIENEGSYQHAFAADFARAGYLVYVMENIGMEDEQDLHLDIDQALRLEGWSWYSLLFAHQRIVLDCIFSDSDADSNRVGTAGVSTGGLLALSAAAQEPRIIAASVQGIFGSMRTSFIKDRGRHCKCGAIVGLLPDFDLPVLALLVAPHFLHIANGKYDGFPPEEARRSLGLIDHIFRKFSFPEPEFTVSPGGHEFDVSSAMEFFDKRLK